MRVLRLQFVLLVLIVSTIASAQQSIDSIVVGHMDNIPTLGDTVTLLVEKQMLQDLSQDQKNTIMAILRHGTTSLYNKDPFLFPSDYYAIIRPPDDPYRNNVDQLLKSMEANLRKDYEKGRIANDIGETLRWFSFLLIFL
jgi:hypothetical protein